MTDSQFSLEVSNLHWMEELDEQEDLCPHGVMWVKIGVEVLVGQEDPPLEWSLSATAMHLLRTLELDHQQDNYVGGQLIPCCGHHIDHIEGEEMVHIQGCPNGIDWWVSHHQNQVELKTFSGTEIRLPFSVYQKEVLKIVDAVDTFFRESKPKKLPVEDYDRIGFLKMKEEWARRRSIWK